MTHRDKKGAAAVAATPTALGWVRTTGRLPI